MKIFRASGFEDMEPDPEPRLRVVSRVAPSRPRWGALYITLAIVGGADVVAHIAALSQTLVRGADLLSAVVLFGVLAVWVRLNRVALTRLDEPAAGRGHPPVRIVRSRKPVTGDHDGIAAGRELDERVILPYDFR